MTCWAKPRHMRWGWIGRRSPARVWQQLHQLDGPVSGCDTATSAQIEVIGDLDRSPTERPDVVGVVEASEAASAIDRRRRND